MKNLIQAAAFVTLLAASAAQAQQAVQWRVDEGGNGHWYQLRARVPGRDWHAWRVFAGSVGGHLATLTTSAENAFVASPRVWGSSAMDWPGGHAMIGLYQPSGSPEPAGGWRWVTDESFAFDPGRWASLEDCCPGSPYCSGEGEDAAAMWSWAGESEVPGLAAKWNDVGQCLDWWGAIIEWSADCNGDGITDYGQILKGQLPDSNTNGVPDGCECATSPNLPACCVGDLNQDGAVDGADLGTLLNSWGACPGTCLADFDRNGFVDGADLGALLGRWGPCGN